MKCLLACGVTNTAADTLMTCCSVGSEVPAARTKGNLMSWIASSHGKHKTVDPDKHTQNTNLFTSVSMSSVNHDKQLFHSAGWFVASVSDGSIKMSRIVRCGWCWRQSSKTSSEWTSQTMWATSTKLAHCWAQLHSHLNRWTATQSQKMTWNECYWEKLGAWMRRLSASCGTTISHGDPWARCQKVIGPIRSKASTMLAWP